MPLDILGQLGEPFGNLIVDAPATLDYAITPNFPCYGECIMAIAATVIVADSRR
jgi:hypothetical protein